MLIGRLGIYSNATWNDHIGVAHSYSNHSHPSLPDSIQFQQGQGSSSGGSVQGLQATAHRSLYGIPGGEGSRLPS